MSQSDELITAKMRFNRQEYAKTLKGLESIFEGLTDAQIELLHEAGEIPFGICFHMRGLVQRKWGKVGK